MKTKRNGENKDLLISLQQLMEDLDVPDWLQRKTIKILEIKKQMMTDEVLYQYLEQLGRSETKTLPDELMNEEWLQSVYASHSNWVEKEITFLEETTYESFNTHLVTTPQSIKDMTENAQRSYIAVSSCLFNVFAQIDDIFYQKKTVKSQSNEGNPSIQRKLFRFLIAAIGYPLIIFSYMSAIAAFTTFDEEGLVFYFVMLLFMGMIPFIIGLFLVRDVTLKNFYKHAMFRIYCYFALVVPFGLYIFINLMEWKENLLEEPDFIFLRLVSDQWVGALQSLILVIIILLAGPITVWRKNRKKFLISISIFFLMFAILQYVTIHDYQAIGKDGVVQSAFGSNQTYDWNKVESVYLSGKTDFPPLAGIARSKEFKWSFQFDMENGDTVSFESFGYREGPIEDSLKIKNKIKTENIPMQIDSLTEEDRAFVKIDMDYLEPELKDKFFKLFEIDSF
ncbi:hypothetical protein [Virgibacillus salinus]|uniref:Uncharacterized protein n=1 Tax=Virgibacillus salinus TaxID=553311 RepID=A0A1H1GD30_9BACI|nr:hypothetical protein [Virgibacillus salinus]SDR11081.1 hypothetical protein SAMN05216231_3650 [Virgibacillus salinus]